MIERIKELEEKAANVRRMRESLERDMKKDKDDLSKVKRPQMFHTPNRTHRKSKLETVDHRLEQSAKMDQRKSIMPVRTPLFSAHKISKTPTREAPKKCEEEHKGEVLEDHHHAHIQHIPVHKTLTENIISEIIKAPSTKDTEAAVLCLMELVAL